MLFLNELANKIGQVRHYRTEARRRTRNKNLAAGAGIGVVVGAAAGLLLAPKSGSETRGMITEKIGETAENLKNGAASVKEKMVSKGEDLKHAGRKGVKAAKEDLKKETAEKKAG